MMDFQSWQYCPYCGGQWDQPKEQLAKRLVVCGGCGCGFVNFQAETGRLETEIKRLQAIIALLPKNKDGKPILPSINPKDGTEERLGIMFRYSYQATADAAGGEK